MAFIIFIFSITIEIGLTVLCISTKSNQKIIRSWTHIGELLLFTTFMLTSVITWSFRWKPVYLILLFWAILGGYSLIKIWFSKKKGLSTKEKAFKTMPTLFKMAAYLLLIFIALIPAFIFPQYKIPELTGPHKVETAVYTYKDDSRIETFNNTGEKRKLTAQFWFPADSKKKWPLILFSHGAFGIRASNTSTYNELASNGYVVCSIDHPYHSLYTIDTEGNFTMADKSFIQEVLDVDNGLYDDETEYNLDKKWLKLRTDDMNFVLDTIKAQIKSNSPNEVYQLIDTSKIGVMGHSLGGAASTQLGRDRNDVSAVINLDGDLLGEYTDFVNGKPVINKNIYPVPLLTIYSDVMKKRIAGITDPSFLLPQKYIQATAPKSFEVYIPGTNHFSFTDLPLVSPFLVKQLNGSIKDCDVAQTSDKYYIINKMNNTILKFFDCFLKNEGNFKAAAKD